MAREAVALVPMYAPVDIAPPQRHAGEVGDDGDKRNHGHSLHGAVEMHQGRHQQNGGAKANHPAQHARA